MMVVLILTDNQIREFIARGFINITPPPIKKQFQPASLDWRIGAVEIFDSATIEANS